MDKIWIKDLEIFAYHGVLAEEKRNGQNFYVTVSMDVDLHAAGMTDDLDKTVNYAEVCELIRRTMQEESYDLIEAAAENVADAILLALSTDKDGSCDCKQAGGSYSDGL